MNKIGTFDTYVRWTCFLILLFISLWMSEARADTIISTDILVSTSWTQAGSPYVVTQNINVLAGATLTIDPGVIVRFNSQTGMSVLGRLLAEGNSPNPILITGSQAIPGSWEGIGIYGTSAAHNSGSRFNYVTIEYGGNYYANTLLSGYKSNSSSCIRPLSSGIL